MRDNPDFPQFFNDGIYVAKLNPVTDLINYNTLGGIWKKILPDDEFWAIIKFSGGYFRNYENGEKYCNNSSACISTHQVTKSSKEYLFRAIDNFYQNWHVVIDNTKYKSMYDRMTLKYLDKYSFQMFYEIDIYNVVSLNFGTVLRLNKVGEKTILFFRYLTSLNVEKLDLEYGMVLWEKKQ